MKTRLRHLNDAAWGVGQERDRDTHKPVCVSISLLLPDLIRRANAFQPTHIQSHTPTISADYHPTPTLYVCIRIHFRADAMR